jgi:hypothetical protein
VALTAKLCTLELRSRRRRDVVEVEEFVKVICSGEEGNKLSKVVDVID